MRIKFERDIQSIKENPQDAMVILIKRSKKIEKLRKELKCTKNAFRAKCIIQDLNKEIEEYAVLDKMV